jgi:hypothetical protein
LRHWSKGQFARRNGARGGHDRLLNSSGKLSDDEVTDICRNAQALLPDAGVDADDARTALAGITLTRTVAR